MFQAFAKITGFLDPKCQTLQDNTEQSFKRLNNAVITDGVLVTNIALNSSTPTLVAHGLARQYLGWIVVDNTASATLWRPVVTAPVTLLPLIASATTVVSLWVF